MCVFVRMNEIGLLKGGRAGFRWLQTPYRCQTDVSSLDSSSDLLLDLRSASSSAGASDRDGGLTAESDKDNDTDVLKPVEYSLYTLLWGLFVFLQRGCDYYSYSTRPNQQGGRCELLWPEVLQITCDALGIENIFALWTKSINVSAHLWLVISVLRFLCLMGETEHSRSSSRLIHRAPTYSDCKRDWLYRRQGGIWCALGCPRLQLKGWPSSSEMTTAGCPRQTPCLRRIHQTHRRLWDSHLLEEKDALSVKTDTEAENSQRLHLISQRGLGQQMWTTDDWLGSGLNAKVSVGSQKGTILQDEDGIKERK